MQTIEMPADQIERALMGADENGRVPSKEAAARLQVTTGRIRQLLGEGKLSGIKDDKDDWLVDVASVQRYRRYQEGLRAAKNLLKGDRADE